MWPFYYGLYMNKYYLIGTVFVILAALLAVWAQMKVQSAYSRYKKIPNSKGMTGAQIAREILDSEGLYNIQIFEVKGNLSDHYNPGKKRLIYQVIFTMGHQLRLWQLLLMNVDMRFNTKMDMYLFLYVI